MITVVQYVKHLGIEINCKRLVFCFTQRNPSMNRMKCAFKFLLRSQKKQTAMGLAKNPYSKKKKKKTCGFLGISVLTPPQGHQPSPPHCPLRGFRKAPKDQLDINSVQREAMLQKAPWTRKSGRAGWPKYVPR